MLMSTEIKAASTQITKLRGAKHINSSFSFEIEKGLKPTTYDILVTYLVHLRGLLTILIWRWRHPWIRFHCAYKIK